jgi:hypothetical protein
VACLLALALAIPLPLLAQQPAASPFRPEELEQIAAPIALYPDPLLAQVLMAATYPLEVVQAARFVQANPGLTGDRLAEALQARRWDDSVKSLVTFPQVLGMMNDKLDWTQKLGDAFLEQQQDLMDAVQRLRARAQAQGTLATTPQQTVTIEAAAPQPIIQIEPANPQVIYVPTYNPSVVYGPWPYPAYPPYYYYPPGWLIPGVFFTFGVGFVVGTALWGVCDWHRHDVHIDIDRYRRFTHTVNVEGRRGGLEHPRGEPREGDRPPWQHDPQHRRGVDYRDAVIQQRFGRTWAPDAAAREAFRGRAEQGRVELGRGWAEPPKGLPGKARPDLGRSQPRGAPRPEVSRPPGPAPGPSREPGAFQGLGRGGDVRSYSNRGRESRQSIAPPSPGIRSAPPRVAPGGGARGGAPPGGRGAPGGERRR